MKIAAIAFTDKGMTLGMRLKEQFGADFMLTRCTEGGLAAWVGEWFMSAQALIFIGAAGIAVRAIAPWVQSKISDPAVLALDEGGSYVIPLLGGHMGGANELARRVAALSGALPVITTATDVGGVWAVDEWARRHNLAIDNPQRVKWISARLLAGESIRLKSHFPVTGDLPAGIIIVDDEEYDIIITWRNSGRQQALRLIPRIVTLGVGCKKGVDCAALTQAFQATLAKAGCHMAAVCRVCSIDIKADEPALAEFCRKYSLPLHFYSAAELGSLSGDFNGSDFVRKITGVDNVCERSAVLGSGGQLLCAKTTISGVTMALAIAPYTVSFPEEI